MASKQKSQKTERTFNSLKDFSDAFFAERLEKKRSVPKKKSRARKKRVKAPEIKT